MKREVLGHPAGQKRKPFGVYFAAVFTLFLCLFLVNCKRASEEINPSGPIKVKIPVYSESRNKYELQEVELTTVENLSQLRGSAAQFVMSPGLDGKQLVGQAPTIHTMKSKSGVFIATDSFSLQLLSVYASFERQAKFDNSVGIGSLLSWPRTVGVEVQTPSSKNSDQIDTDNARYSGELDAFLFVPYSRDDLPLMANQGVISHEHFHSIFQRLVVEPITLAEKQKAQAQQGLVSKTASLSEVSYWFPHELSSLLQIFSLRQDPVAVKPVAVSRERMTIASAPASSGSDGAEARAFYHQVLMRGVNEGLADTWAWINTGDPRFVERSLRTETCRNLSKLCDRIGVKEYSSYKSEKISETLQATYVTGGGVREAYIYGTVVATNLIKSAQALQQSHGLSKEVARQRLAKALVTSLTRLSAEYNSLSSTDLLHPYKIWDLVKESDPEMPHPKEFE